MEPRYQIRSATRADLQSLLGLGMADVEYHRSLRPDLPPTTLALKRGRYEAVLEADNGVILVVDAHPPGVPVAMLVAFIEPQRPARPLTLYVEEAYVGRKHRRHGLMRALVGRVARWGRERGVARVELEYVVGNEAGASTWSSLGFVPRSVRAGAEVAALVDEG